jgi:hypothetical protein
VAIVYLAVLIGYAFLICYPISRVLKRLGFSGWWSLLAIVPLANLVSLWIVAFTPWPRDGRAIEAFS